MSALPVPALALAVALLLDRHGEPPALLHPVVWMGRGLGALGAPWPGRTPAAAFMRGVAAWWLGALAVTGCALLVGAGAQQLGQRASGGVGLVVLVQALALKPLFAWHMLVVEVSRVGEMLEEAGIEAARVQLSRLVSRDTRALTATEVRESALESLAENFNDSFVAPLFWFVLGGLPAAALYRFANTADALWGYRGRWEWAGKWAARADDVLSYLPARLAALFMAIAALRIPRGLASVARVTPSPNGGWPMGAMALLLGVRLSKPGVYALNGGGGAVDADRFAAGLALGSRAATLAALVVLGALIAESRW